jgi:hypothetical protein
MGLGIESCQDGKFYFDKISGVDVRTTIFYNICQFSAKKLAFFSKTNVMIKFLQKLVSPKIFLNHNIGPRPT